MSLTSAPIARPATAGGRAAGMPPAAHRRVSVPWMAAGLAVILAGLLAGAILAGRVDARSPVLVAIKPVPAGQMITAADVGVARVSADESVATMPGAQLSAVIGRVAAVPLRRGELLAPGDIGPATWPPAGQAAMAVSVQPGHAPSSLAAGGRVSIVVAPTAASTGTVEPRTVRASAVVVSIEDAADQSGAQVVTVLLTASDAQLLAAANGDVTLIQLGVGG